MFRPDDVGSMRRTEDDEAGAHYRGGSAATGSLEGQEHGWGQKDTADGREHAHSHVWDAWLDIVLSNILEVEVALESGKPAEERDHQLCERGVHIHKKPALDVLGRKAAKAVGKAC